MLSKSEERENRMNAINPVLRKVMVLISLSILSGMVPAAQAAWQTIHNDFYWYDQDGNSIQTRSGCLCKFSGVYYWYGGTNGFVDQTCYTSTDLIHWTYKGVPRSADDIQTERHLLLCDICDQLDRLNRY
jgi:hypothetical protein